MLKFHTSKVNALQCCIRFDHLSRVDISIGGWYFKQYEPTHMKIANFPGVCVSVFKQLQNFLWMRQEGKISGFGASFCDMLSHVFNSKIFKLEYFASNCCTSAFTTHHWLVIRSRRNTVFGIRVTSIGHRSRNRVDRKRIKLACNAKWLKQNQAPFNTLIYTITKTCSLLCNNSVLKNTRSNFTTL